MMDIDDDSKTAAASLTNTTHTKAENRMPTNYATKYTIVTIYEWRGGEENMMPVRFSCWLTYLTMDGAVCKQVRRKFYYEGGDLTKAAAALAGLDVARCNLGLVEDESGNMEQAIKY